MQFTNPIGGDIRPFDGLVSYSTEPRITERADGSFLFVSGVFPNDANASIMAQAYSASGQAQGDPIMLVTDFRLTFQNLDAVALADGGIALSYSTYDSSTSTFASWVQSFDGNGTARAAATSVFGDVGEGFFTTQMVALDGGGFMVAGTGAVASGEFNLQVRNFNASGAPASESHTIGDNIGETQRLASLNTMPDGTHVLTWQERDIFAARFSADGTLAGSIFEVSPSGSTNSSTGIGEGNILAVWNTYNGDEFDIFGRIMATDGTVVQDTFRINTTTAENQLRPVAGALSDGTAVVAWVDESGIDGAGSEIRAQRIAADGTFIGEEFRVNAQTANDQNLAQIDVLGNDRIVFAWEDGFDSAEGREKLGELRMFTTELAPPAPIVGTPGADTLDGTEDGDEISGLGGADVLRGMGGNDTLEGGDGPDTINGGDGDDLIRGGDTDADRRDVIYAGAGNDSVDGGYGNDLIFGQGGNDTIAGGFGADELQGQDGDDVITGSAFGDIVFGNAGDDFVNGGFGHDLINGGTGADKFFHTGGSREQMEGHGSDWVQDYSAAEGDVLVFGGAGTAGQFQVNLTHTANKTTGERSGDDDVEEAFVIYRPTGQILWALVDGGGETSINLQIGAEVFDLLA